MDTNTVRRWRGPYNKALIIENPDPSLDGMLRDLGIEPHRLDEPPASEDELVKILEEGQYHFLYKRSRTEITERVLRASDNLAGVMLCCIGDDSVDKEAAARLGVMVTNDPVSNGRSVAELVIGEIIMLSRRIFEATTEMDTSTWRKNNIQRYEIRGKSIGILGLGRIGRQVAQLAEAMGLQVFFFDNNDIAHEVGVTLGWNPCDSIDELFRTADIISVHVSAQDHRRRSNRGLLTYEHFKAMGEKQHEGPPLFPNLARGFLYNPDDLKRAVNERHIHFAITDVFPEEPSRSAPDAWTNPYADTPRIFATPHIGAATREAQPRIARYVATTTKLFSQFGTLRNCVFRPSATISVNDADCDHLLVVVHSDKRGTKKAVDDAIYHAGASNIRSAHYDFPGFGIAYDLAAIDRELSPDQLEGLIHKAVEITGDPHAIRALRTIDLRVFK